MNKMNKISGLLSLLLTVNSSNINSQIKYDSFDILDYSENEFYVQPYTEINNNYIFLLLENKTIYKWRCQGKIYLKDLNTNSIEKKLTDFYIEVPANFNRGLLFESELNNQIFYLDEYIKCSK